MHSRVAVIAANLGCPRIGRQRELKTALEQYWGGEISQATLREIGCSVRRESWALQVELGIDHVPSNDFSLYDHVLDMAAVVGAVPRRFGTGPGAASDLAVYFAMARGGGPMPAGTPGVGTRGPSPLRMTKWFDTNYHFLVPELDPDGAFELASTKPLDEFLEAKAQGIHTRPVLLGPVSLARLSRLAPSRSEPSADVARVVERLVPVYGELLRRLERAGADWVQMDEPVLALDLAPGVLDALVRAYEHLGRLSSRLRILLAAYFGGLGPNLATALHLPISGLHLDLTRAPQELEPALAQAPATLSLSLGVIDGRNVWRADLERALSLVETACQRLGPERVQVAPSCSLLHCPIDLDLETGLDHELREWLAFGRQKLAEIVTLVTALRRGRAAVSDRLAQSQAALVARRASGRARDAGVRARLEAVTPEMRRRASPPADRRAQQRERHRLPLLPTTTIGSFPQTAELRRTRAAFRAGALPRADYEHYVRGEIDRGLHEQEALGLDVLVHGEFERADMVEYFAEELEGFTLTRHGWVQSYGSRCVKPPILYGDVARRGPITVRWSRFAQSRTGKPVKGMLTAETGDEFHIEAAAHPEFHPEAPSAEGDLAHFARKVAAGVDSAVTQYFYNADAYFSFVESCARRGLALPIVPGIMPIVGYERLVRFSAAAGVEIPRWLRRRLDELVSQPEALVAFGVDMVSRLCAQLLAGGAPGLHFYTMNRAEPTSTIWIRLGLGRARPPRAGAAGQLAR